MDISERIREVLRIDPAAGAIEFERVWHSWGELSAIVDAADRELTRAGLGLGAAVGVILRNRPSVVGALLAVLATRRCVVSINPHQGDTKLAGELRQLRLPAIIACRADWDRPEVATAAAAVGSLGLALSVCEKISRGGAMLHPSRIEPARRSSTLAGGSTAPALLALVRGLERLGPGPHREPLPGVAVEMLTSGTTGPPKRVKLSYDALEQSLTSVAHYQRRKGDGERRTLRQGVAIISAPLVHVGGLWRTVLCMVDGRPIALLERFRVEPWLELVKRHRPKTVSLVPAAVRMVLDANLAREDLSSIKAVLSSTAPLPPETAVAFEERYGIPVLVSYGATEFAGGVAGWTIEDHRKWAQAKRGSVGRAHPGCELRVVDPGDGRELAPGSVGLLEVRSAQASTSGWVRTTDLAVIDTDGFVWIQGRADNVINRGGFKIVPADVARVLERHPSVREAAVVGVPDPRLGEVPVAAVELEEGAAPMGGEQLRAFAREHLVAYQVPKEVRVVHKLPRTASMKVSEEGVRALFQTEPAAEAVAAGETRESDG